MRMGSHRAAESAFSPALWLLGLSGTAEDLFDSAKLLLIYTTK